MKKTLIMLGAAVVLLTSTLAFRSKSTVSVAPSQEQQVASTSNSSGFALQDQDQWK